MSTFIVSRGLVPGLLFLMLCSVQNIASAAPSPDSSPIMDSIPADVLPFDQPPLPVLRSSPRKVFTHYFTPFPLSIDNNEPSRDYYATQFLTPGGEHGKHAAYGGFLRERPLPREPLPGDDWRERDLATEVRRAVALGLDGFTCDLLDYQGGQMDAVRRLLVAAHNVDPGFKILLMPDMTSAFKAHPEALQACILELAKSPAAYRLDDGRLVVSPYCAEVETPDWWRTWLAAMKAAGENVALVPLFQGWSLHAKDFAPFSIGMSDWGMRSVAANTPWRSVPAQAHAYMPIWMMPVSPQDFRPRPHIFWEASGSGNYRTMWENAILGGADWVQIVTWNDYSESTEISPSTRTQFAFYDLTAYYTSWFKTGLQPKITRDVLYYFHRIESTSAAPDPVLQPQKFRVTGVGEPEDQIELLAFLTRPGELEISAGGQTWRRSAPAGVTSFRVPLAEGQPRFRLLRRGQSVLDFSSAFTVSNRITYQDFLYRGGSSSRPAVSVTANLGN